MLILIENMQGFFREALEKAIKDTKINITDEAKIYIIHMLHEFSRSEKAFAGLNYQENLILVDMLQRAYEAQQNHEALEIFKHLGDSSLYILGFFPLRVKNLSPIYYESMGSTAYLEASILARSQRAQTAALFLELSDRFAHLVKLVEKISTYSPAKNNN